MHNIPILHVVAFGQRYNSPFTNSLDPPLLVVNYLYYYLQPFIMFSLFFGLLLHVTYYIIQITSFRLHHSGYIIQITSLSIVLLLWARARVRVSYSTY